MPIRSLKANSHSHTSHTHNTYTNTQADEQMKCELEALNAFSGAEGRRDFLCQFVVSSLLSGDYVS